MSTRMRAGADEESPSLPRQYYAAVTTRLAFGETRSCTKRWRLRLLVLHGDEFDAVIKHGFLSKLFGAVAYRTVLGLNRFVHWLHEVSGRPYWSLAQHVKTKVGRARRYIAAFRHASLHAAEAAGVDGIVCGHIHKAELLEHDNGLVYCNAGDWVESCTALTEQPDGRLELLTWRPQNALAPFGQPLRDAA